MLETSFPSFISKKLGEIPIFRTFMAKIQFWPIFHCKSAFFDKIDNYDVIVTSYMGCLYCFGMYGKRRPIIIPWYQISIPQVFIFQVHRENSLVRRGLSRK